KLDHLAVVCRAGLDGLEQAALDSFTAWKVRPGEPARPGHLWQAKGKPDLICVPMDWAKRPQQLQVFRGSNRLVAVTPFVTVRHYRRGRGSLDDWMEGELRLELQRRGLPEPLSVTRLPMHRLSSRTVSWWEFVRSRKNDTPRPGYGYALEFAEPVPGPVCLGYGCHFGLGLFLPAP
ncbi:MAG: type I-U CRISPR-associated protein Csb2, partial [Candidatus Eremiobacterota bacterium]